MKREFRLERIVLPLVWLLFVAVFSACNSGDQYSPLANTPPANEEAAVQSPAAGAEVGLLKSGNRGSSRNNGNGKKRKGDGGTAAPDILLTCGGDAFWGRTTKAVIGPRGGVINHGVHQLSFPPGAITKATTITVAMPSPDSLIFDFSPHGIRFNRNVSLTLTYQGSCAGDLDETEVEIVYFDTESQEWHPIQSAPMYGKRQVRGYTKHFSRYALSRR